MDIRIVDYQSTTAAGINVAALRTAIKQQSSGLRYNKFPNCDIDTYVGQVQQIEDIELGAWQSRNNALAALGLEQGSIMPNIKSLISKYSAHRIGIAIGSSTASIDRTEYAYQELNDGKLSEHFKQPEIHHPGAPSQFIAYYTGIRGPAVTVNTACSSSAKVFATASRWLSSGITDAVLVGGVDSLCLSVLYGFHSLQLLSSQKCRPFDRERDGINLGEASAYALLTRPDPSIRDSGICLLGYGESSDAHHMSHPHPEGLGAKLAIEQALASAQLSYDDIDYINLHGTASRANDAIEGKLISNMFTKDTLCSSTKALTGHTLGASGITEALIAIDSMKQNIAPASSNLDTLDIELDFTIVKKNIKKNLHHVMSNSFGFGGNNCCLVFGKAPQQT